MKLAIVATCSFAAGVVVMLTLSIAMGDSSKVQEAETLGKQLAEKNARYVAEIQQLKDKIEDQSAGVGEHASKEDELSVDDFFLPFTREQLEERYLVGWSTKGSFPDLGAYQYVKEHGLVVSISEDSGRVGKFEIDFHITPEHVAIAKEIVTGLFPEINQIGFDTIVAQGDSLAPDVFGPLLVLGSKTGGYIRVQMSPHNVAFGHSQRTRK